MNAAETWVDPIVEEIHQVRREMLAEAGGTLSGLMQMIAASEKKYGRNAAEKMVEELHSEAANAQH